MAQDKEARAAGLLSIGAITAALIALANKAKAAPGGEIVLPEEFVRLVAAIASTTVDIDSLVAQILNKGVTVQAWPPNVKYVRSFTVLCTVAGQPYRANQMTIPDGMNLVIKNHPTNAAACIIQVATSPADSININSSYPLVRNEAISYAVQDAYEFYVSSNVANQLVVFTAERKD
jgi:hypothetical protein